MEKNTVNDGYQCTSHRRLPQSSPKCKSKKRAKTQVSTTRKKKLTKNNIEHKDYTNKLPDNLLELISERLESVKDFCSLGSVNRRWWKNYESSKGKFLASLPPLAVLISTHAKRACYLYDVSSGRTEKVMLPSLSGKYCIDCSAGYIILEHRCGKIELINPFTERTLYFPNTPSTVDWKPGHDRIILATAIPSESFILVSLSMSKKIFQVYQCKNDNLQVFSYANQPYFLTDIVVMKGKIYVVTNYGQIWEWTLGNSSFNWLELKNTPLVSSGECKLVVLDGHHLIMVDLVPERQLGMYKLDFAKMEWVKMDSLGDKALFWGKKGSAMKEPGKWGGRSNCVYCIDYFSTICSVYSMKAELIDRFPIVENPTTSTLAPYYWYFQDESMTMKIESLQEN